MVGVRLVDRVKHYTRCHSDSLFTGQQRDGGFLHIVFIAWLWVVLMLAITERSIVGAVLTFVFYGLLPSVLLWWISAAAARRRASHRIESVTDEQMRDPDRADSSPDQRKLGE